jgi:hypothetical protein
MAQQCHLRMPTQHGWSAGLYLPQDLESEIMYNVQFIEQFE